ncbi:hypothetical protein [Aporhodopirellula aestuarii]|uniref:CRISPR-associated protein Csx3 n=1 Tax=Aporhodopirellula aestuarii TaxID=2950107 RepID=A0ABT0UB09_9BACT|nr:hypothetical protein [Aporhodopirellula aestuarii]MCM2373997.1 hypothetical protein [Aporhodopirellula aestuarii]
MSLYEAKIVENTPDRLVVEVAFGEPATNDKIVPAAVSVVEKLQLTGGPMILFSGPMSLPVAFAVAHIVAHRYGVVGIHDPKLRAYVVAISHDPAHTVGSLLSL